jgi:hypothetical protein
LELFAPHAQLAIAAPQSSTDVSSWAVATKRGTQSGVGVSVSGAGAWARLDGKMTFQLRHLDKATTFDSIKSQYSIAGGVSGFFGWLLGLSASATQQHEEVHQAFNEVANSQAVDGTANIGLECTGQYPNVQVSASGFVLVLQITDSSGNTYNMISTGNPPGDTGAQDQNGIALPQRNNGSTITI